MYKEAFFSPCIMLLDIFLGGCMRNEVQLVEKVGFPLLKKHLLEGFVTDDTTVKPQAVLSGHPLLRGHSCGHSVWSRN